MLTNIGALTEKSETELLIVFAPDNNIVGGLIYFGDMRYYGSGRTATKEKNAACFRLLAVDNSIKGQGIGEFLTEECIQKTKNMASNYTYNQSNANSMGNV